MATASFKATIDASKTVIAGGSADIAGKVDAANTALLALAADIAVLVADAATPTQAHVNTANTDLTALNTAMATAVSSKAAGDAVLEVNKTNIASLNDLKKVLNALFTAAVSSGEFT